MTATITYTVYSGIGIELTSQHIGKDVVRVYPYKRHSEFSFDCIRNELVDLNAAKVKLVTAGKNCVIVSKGYGEMSLPNDGNWLLVDDFHRRTKAAVSHTITFQKPQLK